MLYLETRDLGLLLKGSELRRHPKEQGINRALSGDYQGGRYAYAYGSFVAVGSLAEAVATWNSLTADHEQFAQKHHKLNPH